MKHAQNMHSLNGKDFSRENLHKSDRVSLRQIGRGVYTYGMSCINNYSIITTNLN